MLNVEQLKYLEIHSCQILEFYGEGYVQVIQKSQVLAPEHFLCATPTHVCQSQTGVKQEVQVESGTWKRNDVKINMMVAKETHSNIRIGSSKSILASDSHYIKIKLWRTPKQGYQKTS